MSDEATPQPTIPIDRQIKCIEREIAFRKRVYPKWVVGGRMTQTKADEEIGVMLAVLETLEALARKGRLL